MRRKKLEPEVDKVLEYKVKGSLARGLLEMDDASSAVIGQALWDECETYAPIPGSD